ncbi:MULTISPECIES: DNA polymerase III subunit delta [unclassified Fusibacter]|uniref:DNA polymerase III subunit delta n=1 Tax=unclassified Fusibacter TaxID=2624464 RepID=UPI001013A011|nr:MULTISPECIES: DNA polymerase III subunit delta [unclassified Fusibacter]MCK8058010.1 DNA polymerase III subunit delta [Fusibacter sp. A2]NPE20592.1 DNA polymerase III subunit delta [Fusibacter sp. A1]RXV62799.1 DNA polymerase III subunit delta [Fusibacter sp. A1]
MSYKEFYEDIKSESFKSLYVFYGPEKLLIESMLEQARTKCLLEHVADFNYVVKEAEGITYQDAFSMIEMLPVMDERRIVVLKEPTFLVKDEWGDKSVSSFIKYHENNQQIMTILVMSGIDKRKKAFKDIAKIGKLVHFDHLDERELFKWIKQEAKKGGKTISDSACHVFVDRTGYLNKETEMDLYGLLGLIKTLMHGTSSDEITKEQVISALKLSVDANIFVMVDSLFEGRAKVAFNQLYALVEGGEAAIKIMFMIQRHIRQLLKVKLLAKEGFSAKAISDTLGLKPFVVKKSLNQVSRLSVESLRNMLFDAQRADANMKSSLDPQTVLETLMTRILSR